MDSELERFTRQKQLPVPAEEAFGWHERPGALERLIPPWEHVRVLRRQGGIRDGDRLELLTYVGPVPVRWVAEHRDYEPGRRFRDVQIRGPFARWDHEHRFEPTGSVSCELVDDIRYRLRGGRVGRLLAGSMVRRQLERMFRYRHDTTAADLAAHGRCADRPRLDICVSGSSGLIGSALVPFLTTGGHRVRRIVRRETGKRADCVGWDPLRGQVELEKLEGADAVVHLAGANLADGRWNAEKKARIRDSRVQGTRVLCEALARLKKAPKVLVSASAIGYYGSRGQEPVDETRASGEGFLAQVCREWEEATRAAEECGIRVVHLRIGMVLTPRGGGLRSLLLPFKLGAGGRIGGGQQYWSWITIDDAIGAIHHAMMNESLRGPVNAVSLQPSTNQEFTKTLGRVLRRPTLLAMPAKIARLALGEMADHLVLAGARILPNRLSESEYSFRHADLESALRHVLGKYNSPQ